jgi:drug/metabolite transporter (DMT)-like permease
MNVTSFELLPLIMIITGGVLYHVAQKATPKGVDPFLALFLSFGLASLACLSLAIFRSAASTAQFRNINWTSLVLAISLVAIESGYLIGYRAGLKLNITSFVCNNLIAVALFVIGTIVYAERFTVRNSIGALLCIAGLVLLGR